MTGTIAADPPNEPRMPVDRSCEIDPRTLPVEANLNERYIDGRTPITSESAIGISTGPIERNGWPKASTLPPSTQVTVPVAAIVMSPEIRIVATDDPGRSGGSAARAGRALPAAGTAAGNAAPLGAGRKPARSNASEKRESPAGKGEAESGIASGAQPEPEAGAGNARATRARKAVTKSPPRKVETRLSACARAPLGVGAPIGTGGFAGTWRMSSIDAIGVIPAIASSEKGHP